jgi:hypothetical protein
MTKRIGIAALFVLFGFLSLGVADALYKLACSHFGFCTTYSGSCPGIDVCIPRGWDHVRLVAIYVGPAIIFGITGFIFSRQPRAVLMWVALLAGLVVAHSAVMMVIV